jgi:sterol desaturase/sphingolipid hydroxylase (fatty acid hydroxylase superfamily)
MSIVLVLVLGFFFFEGAGYLIHRLMHARWSGPLWRSHMAHHLKLYPPKFTLSDKYLHPGADSAVWRYVAIISFFAVLGVIFLPLWMALTLIVEVAVVGFLNDQVHDGVHIRNSWLGRTSWGRRLRALHDVHHHNMKKNLGIVTFGLDHVLGTFEDVED